MNTLIHALAPEGWKPNRHEFQPMARYFSAMDFLLYVKEDCNYVEDRVDRRLTLLWHPVEKRAIGVRIKGYRAVYQSVLRILKAHDATFDSEKAFVSLMSSLEVAMLSGDGDEMMAEAEQKRIKEGYNEARKLVKGAVVPACGIEGMALA